MAFRPLSPACLLRAAHRRLADQGGFTIIEVLMSAVLVVMIGLGVFTTFDSATATSGRNKARTSAAALARADQERLRASTPDQLAARGGTAASATKVVNGRTFTVASSASWVADPDSPASCAGLGQEASYLRITSTVTWNGQGSFSPVTLDSIKAIRNGGLADSRGSLAIQLTKDTGTPPAGTANIPVTITGPKSYSATTNAYGCVLLGLVPVGSYTVSVNQPGYVRDKLPNAQAVSETVQVAGEQTTSVPLNYDQAGTLGVKYYTRVPGASSDSTTTGDGFTVANVGMGFPNQRYFGLFTPAATQNSGSTKNLFPFSSGYGVWAGKCAANDPGLTANGGWTPGTGSSQSGNGTGVVPAGGTVSNVRAFEPMVRVTVKEYRQKQERPQDIEPVTVAAKVTATPADSGCTAGYTANTASNGTIADANQPTMPYGSYTLCAQDKTSNPTKRVVQTVDNDIRNGQNVDLVLPFYSGSPSSCP